MQNERSTSGRLYSTSVLLFLLSEQFVTTPVVIDILLSLVVVKQL